MRDIARIFQFGLLGLFGVMGVGLIGLAIANAPAEAQFEVRIAELRAAGEPVSIADLGKDAPDAKDNAATYLEQAAESCLAIQKAVNAVWEREDAEANKRGEKLDDSFDDASAMIEGYRAAFAAHPDVVPLLIKASQCPRYHMNINYNVNAASEFTGEMLADVQSQRATMRVLNYRVRLLLAEGKPEEALETCLVMLRLSNLFAQSPALVGQLVAIALRNVAFEATSRVLQVNELSPAARQKLEGELARQNIRSAYRDSFRTERAFGLSHFEDSKFLATYSALPVGKSEKLAYLDVMDALIKYAGQPSRAKAEMQRILDRAGPLTQALAPAIQATNEAVTRNEAYLRCLRVLNALLAREEGEAKNAQLSDLGLPAEATTDPFNGKSLNLKYTDEGWIIYSVGKNLKDDGGLLDEDLTDVGYGPLKRGS
jgi:hypothetical protein